MQPKVFPTEARPYTTFLRGSERSRCMVPSTDEWQAFWMRECAGRWVIERGKYYLAHEAPSVKRASPRAP